MVEKGIGLAAFVAVVIAVNVAVIDLPSIGAPDLPGWAKAVLHVKNWVLLGVFVVLVALTALKRENA